MTAADLEAFRLRKLKGREMMTISDWLGRTYDVEISFVRFLDGYVVWIDGEVWDDGDEVFPSKNAAENALRRYFK